MHDNEASKILIKSTNPQKYFTIIDNPDAKDGKVVMFATDYFPDKDVPNYTIKNTIWKFKSAFPMYRFFIHNNKYENEKDYGVPENRISDFMWEEK